MTLRRKTLIVVGLVLGALFVVLYLTASNIVLNGFARVEDQIARRNVLRVVEALNDETAKVNRAVGDWAPWDDTYAFVLDANEDYIRLNLNDTVFVNLNINLMLFVNTADAIVHGQGFDLLAATSARVPASLEAHLAAHETLLQHADPDSSVSGFILLPEGPLLVASQPILTSERQGPIRGSLLMGRYLDAQLIEKIKEQTRLAISILRLNDPALPPDFAEARASLLAATSADDAIFIRPLSEDLASGYTMLRDVYGEPGLVLRVDIPRDVFAQGQVSVRALVFSLLAVGAVFVVLTLFILERLVLAPVARLSAGVSEIGASGDISRRLALPGRDELAALANTIDRMLQDLQDSLAREKALRREVQRLRIQIDQSKQQEQVQQIVETDFFQDLQEKARAMRSRSRRTPGDEPGKAAVE